MTDTPDYILSGNRRELTAEDYEWLRINCRKESTIKDDQRYAALLDSHRELLSNLKMMVQITLADDWHMTEQSVIYEAEKAIARAEGI